MTYFLFIFFLISPTENVTVTEIRDACNMDGWSVVNIEASSDTKSSTEHLLEYLKPFTRYACYIKTYTLIDKNYQNKGGLSEILYFMTKPFSKLIINVNLSNYH